MAEGPFPFFRGTFHLFAKDVLGPMADVLALLIGSGAELDLVGDIHSENYGTFETEHRQVHYDINDFDETTRGRFGLDVCRLAISHFLAVLERRGETLEHAVTLTLASLRAYVEAVRRLLKKGKDLHLDISDTQPCGVPVVDDFVRAMAAIKRSAYISRLSVWENGHRRLVRTLDLFNLPDPERAQALRLLADYLKRFPHENVKDGFFDVEDVCGRVSGIGSMGRLRYVVLVAGKGSADARNVLLEFKESLPSAYDTARGRETDADALVKRAERVILVQKQSQGASDPHAGWAVDGGASFQVRQRGPHDDRLRFAKLDAAGVEGAVRVQASILARPRAVGDARRRPDQPARGIAKRRRLLPARARLCPRIRRPGAARLAALRRRSAGIGAGRNLGRGVSHEHHRYLLADVVSAHTDRAAAARWAGSHPR